MKSVNQRTYLTTIKNSLGSRLFQHFYVNSNEKVIDVLQGGALSCAYFISSILKLFGRIPEVHTTVSGTVRAMEKFGWVEVNQSDLQEGDVLVWGEVEYADGSRHGHIGFYIGNGEAISHSAYKKVPVKHHFNFEGKRAIVRALRFNLKA